jgi:hypothetical protein
MPVNVLFCEGNAGSPDARLLVRILGGRCLIVPKGGKYGMGERILGRRDVQPATFGILDGDFVEQWSAAADKLNEWSSGAVHFGWRWNRKEIENYLIDPLVVANALADRAPLSDEYRVALESARDHISVYTAARTALTLCRPRRLSPLPNTIGRPRGSARHPFPDGIDEASCIRGLRLIVAEHSAAQSIDCDAAEDHFRRIAPEFQMGEPRHQHFLYTYAGKDLLYAMDPQLRAWGYDGCWSFLETVLIAIERSSQDVATWLPEWIEPSTLIARA